jgi:hypothetical protein
MDDIVDKQVKLEDNKRLPTVGFHTNPEWINRNGRPKKGTALTEVMREMLESTPELKKLIIDKLLKGAAGGDLAFIREVLDRIDGKPNVTADIHNTGEVVVVPNEVYQKYGVDNTSEVLSEK